jgi:hypothetical protein
LPDSLAKTASAMGKLMDRGSMLTCDTAGAGLG